MQRIFSERLRTRLGWFALTALITFIGLLPWWRNRAYVRSFFDYGVVMGGVGRIESGQRPYVDFITPIQTAWYGFNGLAEKIAGGTFQAMTWSGAASIVVSAFVLMGLLARRWPLLPSGVVAGSLVCATVSQHTIFWYNPWGVVLMAAVAWTGAMAPVYRRSDTGWHVLIGAALFLGGINKINMQALALAIAWGWALRAGLTGRSGWGRVQVTLLLNAVCGLVLPVCAEMAWTGASLQTWWHNVVALPAASRSGTVLAAFSWDFLFKPVHDYYGALLLPQIGLVGLGLSALTVVAVLRKTWRGGGVDRFLPVVCGLLAVLAGAVLLTTNMDIAYIGLAGWLALLVGLWLGFGIPARGGWFYGALVGPALVIGVVSWLSAWQGQRSQFGHSGAARSAYISGDRAGPVFAYFKGTWMPPELYASLMSITAWRQELTPESRRRIFYGPGAEWLAHIWPAMSTPGLPIYIHVGNSLGEREYARLQAAIKRGDFQEIIVSLVQDRWDTEIGSVLADQYTRSPFDFAMFFHYTNTRAELGSISGAPLRFQRRFGGNVDSRFLFTSAVPCEAPDQRSFLGGTVGLVEMRLELPTNRLQGEVVVSRTDADTTQPLAADFAIYAEADKSNRFERWSARVELPAGEKQVVVPYAIDSSHLPAAFTMDISYRYEGKIVAGWRSLRITDAGSDSPSPVWLNQSTMPDTVLDEDALAKLLPGDWRPLQAQMRNGRVTKAGIVLSPGGEIWLQIGADVPRLLVGEATFASNSGPVPVSAVNGLWYKAGRLEAYAAPTSPNGADGKASFQTWCGEPGGWLVIATDRDVFQSPAVIRVTEVVQDH